MSIKRIWHLAKNMKAQLYNETVKEKPSSNTINLKLNQYSIFSGQQKLNVEITGQI